MNSRDSHSGLWRGTRLLLVLALLLAFALRIYRLDGQSLWSDEGASAVMAGRAVPQILSNAAGDIHPPLYYVILHWWSLGVGDTEFALRYLSVAFGLLLVALTAALGRRLLGLEAGVLGAGLASFSPFLVYYSQEMRMYMPVAFFSALSIWLFIRAWLEAEETGKMGSREGRRPGPVIPRLPGFLTSSLPAVGYVLVTAAALYTQYFAFTVLLLENLALLLLRPPFWRHGRLFVAWAVSQLAIVALYLPWFLLTMKQLGQWPAVSEPFGLGTLLRRVLVVFGFGLSGEPTADVKLLAAALVGCGLLGGAWGIVRARRQGEAGWRQVEGLVLVSLFLLVPVFAMYAVSQQRPMYNPKFLVLAAPAFYLLLGRGLALVRQMTAQALQVALSSLGGDWSAVRRSAGILAVGVLVLPLALADAGSLIAYYFVPGYARDDYRGLARQVELSQRPGDAVLLNAPGQLEIFNYYYRGDLPRYPLPRQRPLDEHQTADELAQIAAQHRRLWLVRWAVRESDPQGFVDGWLGKQAYPASHRWYGSVELILYRLPGEDEGSMTPLGVTFGRGIRLLGYRLGEEADSAQGQEVARPGEILPLTLFWEAAESIPERYTVFTHLLDSREYIWGQRDSEPGGGSLPTSGWTVDTPVTDRYGLPVYWGTPPGDYQVEIGLYLPATGQRLPAIGPDGRALGDRVVLGPVRVDKGAPPGSEAVDIQHRLEAGFGPLRLLGYDFHRLGAGREEQDLHQGGFVHLTLYWQAEERPGADYQVVVRVVDRMGQVVQEQEVAPADGAYPTGGWGQGELVRDQHRLLLQAPPGEYRLLVGLAQEGQLVPLSGAKRPTADGMLELQRFEVRP